MPGVGVKWLDNSGLLNGSVDNHRSRHADRICSFLVATRGGLMKSAGARLVSTRPSDVPAIWFMSSLNCSGCSRFFVATDSTPTANRTKSTGSVFAPSRIRVGAFSALR